MPPHKLEYLPADESHKEYFRELNRACYVDVVTMQFGEWDDAVQSRNFDEKWLDHNFRVIEVAGKLVGGVWVDDHDDFLQLREIQIHPEFQGKGYGTIAVQDVINTAKLESKGLRLRVLHLNKAKSLYERLGFIVVDETETQYVMEFS